MQLQYDSLDGVVASTVGFTGGSTANPTYESVCAGVGSHSEAIKVRFDPRVISFERLITQVLNEADATANVTAHYKSAVWPQSDEQEEIALRVASGLGKARIVLPRSPWTDADAQHQRVFAKAAERAAALAAAPPARPPPLVPAPPPPPPAPPQSRTQ